MFSHNLWKEDEIETVSLYLPVPVYNSDNPIKNPEFLIVKQIQWSYQQVSIKVEEETKVFAELAIAISLHQDNPASEIQTFDLPLLGELSCFMESGLGSFEEFYKSEEKEILSLPN